MKLKARHRDRAKSRAVMARAVLRARAELRSILIGLAASTLLGACVEGSGDTAASSGGNSGGNSGASTGPGLFASPGKAGNREIEAPEVFQTTDSALWDGRPSLGGIWVASPEVTDPERVVMFNPATGKSVTGALFRRERDNPGPTLQISSDAAEALGILAGQPTEIRVTALRKEEIAVPVDPVAAEPTAEDPATEGAEAQAPATPDAAAAETAALAAAALDVADGVTDGAADGTVPEVTAVTEPPKKKTWKERRAEAKAKREAEKAAKAAAKAAAAAGTVAGAAVIEGAPLDPVDPAASAVAPIETAPLDARAPEAAVKPAPTAAPAAADPVAATPAPAVTGSRPIQIASFSKEDNAKRAVDALAKIGITAQPQKSGTAAKAVWGVVAMGDAALLAKIKAAGFADAYFLQ
jgi:rare lipoprotein A